MNKFSFKSLDWGSWLYALLKAGITGAASAIVSCVAMPVMTQLGIQMPTITLRQFFVLAAVGGVTHLAAMLMKSPLPPKDGSEVEETNIEPK